MRLIQQVPLEHDGRHYEIRIHSNGEQLRASGYLDGKLVSPWVYFESFDTCAAMGFQYDAPGSGLGTLIDAVATDICEDRWARWCEYCRTRGMRNPLLS